MSTARKKIVIIGGGFAGIAVLKELAHVDAEVIVIDKNSSQVFQPLLFQVATCNISAEDLQSPIREFLKDHDHIQFIKEVAETIDYEKHTVHLQCGWEIAFDYLVITTGSVINYYGMKEVAENAFSMKSAKDALKIRTHILNELDIAANACDDERAPHLTFVIAGGGATGVELAGSLMELLKDDWSRYYPRLAQRKPTLYLVEGSDSVLQMLPKEQQHHAMDWLQRLGVIVKVSTRIEGYDGHTLRMGGEEICTDTLIWCAGVKANPLVDTLPYEKERGRLVVRPTLQLKDVDDIFVAGDSASFSPAPGARSLPMTAAVAEQEGHLVGKNLKALVEGKPLKSFVYKDRGFIAIVSRGHAVGRVNQMEMCGRMCWLIWALLHIFLPYSKHIRWSLFWKFIWNGMTGSSPYRNTMQ